MLHKILSFYNPNRIQIIAVIGSFFILTLIIYLIRKKRLKEEYSLLWLFSSIVLLIMAVWRKGLEYLSSLIGIAYPPAALLLIFIIAIFLIMIQFSIVISRLSEKNKCIAQELGILKAELKKITDKQSR